MEPVISIIIPSFNSEKYLEEAILSVLHQSYSDWECIVVDDHSTDESLLIAQGYCKRFPQKIKVFLNDGKGACAARNFGLLNCMGQYIKFLDSDDVLSNNDVLLLQKEFLETGQYDLVYGNEEYYNNTFTEKNFIRRRGAAITKGNPDTFYQNFPITSNFLVRKEKIAYLAWNENLKSGQEFFLLFQLFNREAKFGYQNETISFIRIHNAEHRISNRPKRDSTADTILLANYMLSDIQSLEISDCIFLSSYNKQILKSSYLSVKAKGLEAAKQIQLSFVKNKRLKQDTVSATVLFALNSVSVGLGYIFYKVSNYIGIHI